MSKIIRKGDNTMKKVKKERVSSNVDRELRLEADAKAAALGISRAKLIEIALKSELDHFNIHKENKRLTEARAKAETATEEAQKQRERFKTKFEEAESNYRVCSRKIDLLLSRNWWERLWNKLPWVFKEYPTEIVLPADKTGE